MTAKWRQHVSEDSGFTLVEAVVALMVLGVIFTAMAYAATGALRASLSSRVEQQAVDFATQALERARQFEYHSLVHADADLAGDSRVTSSGSTKRFDPGGGSEELVTKPTGAYAPHVTTVAASTANRVPFKVSTYITRPTGATADYKRVTVVVTWRMGTLARERVVSSLVTETTRGLPVPVFKLTPVGSSSTAVNAGARVSFAFELTNQGAPDVWDITTSNWGTWSLYREDGDGRLCVAVSTEPGGCTSVDPPMGDSQDAGSTPDTGRVDPTRSVTFWATTVVPSGTEPRNYWMKLTADSASTTTAGVGVSALDLLVQVVAGTVTETPPPPPPVSEVPGTPQSLVLTPSDRTIAATWSAPASPGSSAITDYTVRYRASGDPTAGWIVVDDGVGTTTSATITGLANGTQYDVQVLAVNEQGPSATPASGSATPFDDNKYVPPTVCPAATSAPGIVVATGHTERAYALHNRSDQNAEWPGTGYPAATSTQVQGIPLKMAVDGAQFGAGTNLPVYSSDLPLSLEPPVHDRGRIILAGGNFSTSDPQKVVDWRANTTGKGYSGTAVLRLWVAPVTGDPSTVGYTLSAQLYRQRTTQDSPSDNKLNDPHASAPVTLDAASFSCPGGWQEVWFQMPIVTKAPLAMDESLGIRVWSPGGSGKASRLRIAYDVAGDFPATLTVPED